MEWASSRLPHTPFEYKHKLWVRTKTRRLRSKFIRRRRRRVCAGKCVCEVMCAMFADKCPSVFYIKGEASLRNSLAGRCVYRRMCFLGKHTGRGDKVLRRHPLHHRARRAEGGNGKEADCGWVPPRTSRAHSLVWLMKVECTPAAASTVCQRHPHLERTELERALYAFHCGCFKSECGFGVFGAAQSKGVLVARRGFSCQPIYQGSWQKLVALAPRARTKETPVDWRTAGTNIVGR